MGSRMAAGKVSLTSLDAAQGRRGIPRGYNYALWSPKETRHEEEQNCCSRYW